MSTNNGMMQRANMPFPPGTGQDYVLHSNYDVVPTWVPQEYMLGHVVIRSLRELQLNASASFGDSIYLKPNTVYHFQGHVNIGSASIYSTAGTRIEGRYSTLDQIVANTTASISNYNLNNIGYSLRNIGLYNSNSVGSCITFAGSGSNMNAQFCQATGFKDIIINTCNSFIWENGVISVGPALGTASIGVEVNGTMSTLAINGSSLVLTSSYSTGISFSSGSSITVANIENNTMFLGNASTSGIKVNAGSAVTTGRVIANSFRNASNGLQTSNFDHSSVNWIFARNESTISSSVIKDSDIHLASNFFSSSAITHLVSASGQFQYITGPTITDYFSERVIQLTGSQKNQWQYTGLLSRDMQLGMNLTSNMVSPGDTLLAIAFTQNGTLLSGSIQIVGANKATYGAPPVTSITTIQANPGDIIAPVLANLTNTTNIDIFSIQFTVDGDY